MDDSESTIRSFNKQFQLGKPEIKAVGWAWPKEAGDNMFSVIKAYTRAAQMPDLIAGSSYRLQRALGQILAMVN